MSLLTIVDGYAESNYQGRGVPQPSSLRDASRSSGAAGTSGPWKAAPTVIREPTNRSHGSNPFAGRMSNTLNNRIERPKRAAGNFTSSRTVFAPPTSKYFPGSSTSKPLPSSNYRNGAVIIDDSEEDTGELLVRPGRRNEARHEGERHSPGPDPLDCFASRQSEPSSSRTTVSLTTNPQYRIAGDGPHRSVLVGRVEAAKKKRRSSTNPDGMASETPVEIIDVDGPPNPDDDHDSIHSFSTDLPYDPPAARRPPQALKVKDMVQRIENGNTSSTERAVRQIDFNKVPPGVKQRMKGKGQTLKFEQTQPAQLDPIATASSNFTSSRKTSSGSTSVNRKQQPSTYVLPLRAWFKGVQLHDSEETGTEYWFCFDGKTVNIQPHAEGGEVLFQFKPQEFVGSMECTTYPCAADSPVIVKMPTKGSSKRFPHWRDVGFKHQGLGDQGVLLFQFDTKHANWENGQTYDRLTKSLRTVIAKATWLDKGGSIACWSKATNALEMVKADPSVLPSDDEESATSTKRSRLEAEEAAARSTLRRPQPHPTGQTTAKALTENTRNTRSTRRSAIESRKSSPVADPDELVLVYPPSGTGAVNITRGDLKRLDPGQYLNDTLIEFALKLWLNDLREREPELADQIHIFSSFFYKKIQVKNKEEGYASVRKWTSKFDLFKKRYVVVPINEHLHWYLAIICNPEFVLQPPPPPTEKALSSVQTRKRKRDSQVVPLESGDADDPSPGSPPAPSVSETPTLEAEEEREVGAMLDTCTISSIQEQKTSGGQDDEFGGLQYPDSEGMAVDHGDPDNTSTVAQASASRGPSESIDVDSQPPNDAEELMDVDTAVPEDAPPQLMALSPEVPYYELAAEKNNEDVPNVELEGEPDEPPTVEPTDFRSDKTYIFTFDSLGTKHPAAVRNLSVYLQLEAQGKKGLDLTQTTPATGVTALVPAQPNFCDCGVYLIHFVQTFMKDPVRLSEKIITKKAKEYDSKERELDWEGEAVASLRETLLAKAVSLSEEWKKERTAKEEQKKRDAAAKEDQKKKEPEGTGPPDSEVLPESDDEIVVGEVISKSTAKRGPKTKQTTLPMNDKKDRAGESGSAMRLR